MPTFGNTFSWSLARHNMFYRCEREYYYHYYGSSSGWEKLANERANLLDRLKNIQHEDIYIKNLLNFAISSFVKGEVIFSQKELLLKMKKKLNLDFIDMQRSEFLKDHKKLCLKSYYLEKVNINDLRKAIITKIEEIVDFLFSLSEFLELKNLNYLNFISVSTFEKLSMYNEDIIIFSDLLYYKNAMIVALNFRIDKDQNNLTLDLLPYWLENHNSYRSFKKDIVFIDLIDKRISKHESNTVLEKNFSKIQKSINDMKLRLSQNGAAFEDNFYLCSDKEKCHACRFKEACMI